MSVDKGKGTQNILRCHLLSITPNAQRRVELNIKEWDGRERRKAATCVTGRMDNLNNHVISKTSTNFPCKAFLTGRSLSEAPYKEVHKSVRS